MNLHTQVGVDVSKTDNGWVLEWKDERKRDRSSYTGIGLYDNIPVRGVEVFTDKKKLMERIEQLI